MNETFQRCDCLSISACKTTPILPHPHQKQRPTIKCKMVDCTAIKDVIVFKTLNRFTVALFIVWILVGAALCITFLELEISESRYDIQCYVTEKTPNIQFIRGQCYDQYREQSHKLGIPSSIFILVNVVLIPIVTFIYSQYAKSTVHELERGIQDYQGEHRNRRRTLFRAYLCQLIMSMILEITFIVLIETHLFYPKTFSKHFSCTPEKTNLTQSTSIFNCFHQRAGSKNVSIKFAEATNGIFAFCAFLEILWILRRARKENKFMENLQFYADHLKSNSDEHPEQAQTDFQSAIEKLKTISLRRTDNPADLQQPFIEPQPGVSEFLNLTMDEIYVNLAIREYRAYHNFADQDRGEQLEEYPPNANDCQFAKPEDILDENNKNVLVVGRPGIGKTSLSTKLLRLWASDEAFKAAFNVVFLVRFKRFNDGAKLSLRELLARGETLQSLDDSVWEFVQNQSTKVLLIFDGLDQYSRKQEINTKEDYKNDLEEKMPVSVLYKKLVAGELLHGVSILATTRPTAMKYVGHHDFQRKVEICGFTSKNVEDYVKKFTKRYPGTNEQILGHIKSNINLFSLCYIPVNCFLICHCLLQSILYKFSPLRMTDIYQMTVKMMLFNHMHDWEGFPREKLENLKSSYMYGPFESFPEEFQNIFNSLGKIAFKGVENGRRRFESSEVSGLEDCGLLHKLPDRRLQRQDQRKSEFCFIHLKVQEFFAAKHLVNPKTNENIERFVRDHISHGKWKVVLQFVAGLLNSSSDIFIKLLPKPSEGKWPATKKDKDLAVQVCKCLYEINDEQQNKIEKINFNEVDFSSCSLALIDVAAVLHFLKNAEKVFSIDLSDNNFGDLGANEVKNFVLNRECNLKSLDLSRNNLTDNTAKEFAAALEHSNCKLQWLLLSRKRFTNEGCQYLSAAGNQSNCHVLFL